MTQRLVLSITIPGAALAVMTFAVAPAGADNKRLNDGVVANVYTIQHNAGCTNDVTVNPQLQLAAQWHTSDVLNNRALDGDVGSDGSSVQDRANAAGYQSREQAFESAINAKLQEWGTAMLPFKGQKVVAYHDSWPYFGHRYGLDIDVFLEPKPGIPPSPSHLAEVIAQMKAQHIKAILVEPFHDRKIAERVAEATGAKVVDFAQYPGALPNTDTYIKLQDVLIQRLAAALK